MRRFAVFIVFVALATALGQTSPGSQEGLQEDAIPRDTVMRLLGFPPGAPADEFELLVGALPEVLPVALPVPEDADIVASLVRGDEYVQIIMDVAAPAEAVEAFFSAELQEPLWTRPADQGWRYDIFVPADTGGPVPIYCHEDGDYSLTVSLNMDLRALTPLTAAPSDPTEVRLDLMRVHPGSWPCDQPEQPEVAPWTPEEAYPALRLVAPEGSEQRGGGRSTFERTLIANAQIMSVLEPQELRDHYRAQLREQDWTVAGSGEVAGFAWSAFDLGGAEGEAWQALLIVMSGAAEANEHDVHLIVTRR